MSETKSKEAGIGATREIASERTDAANPVRRRLPVGAEILPNEGAHFRVWAPRSTSVAVQLGRTSTEIGTAEAKFLQSEGDGYFSGEIGEVKPGMLYRYRLTRGSFPDPASRFQPQGPQGPSELVDPTLFEWSDSDYRGTPQEFISAMKWGYIFQGQRYKWQKKRRGTPCFGLEPWRFVNFIQNHDQVANSLRGLRAHQLTSPAKLRAMTALLLLGPGSPMLFQGQEFAASSPFFYFADHNPDLARLVAKGRKEFLSQFRTIACAEPESLLANPEAEETFLRCKLDFSERQKHSEIYQLHRDLLKLRRADPVLSQPRAGGVDGAVLGAEAFVLRFFGSNGQNRLLVVNFDLDLHLDPAPEPLLAPLEGHRWRLQWSSEDCRYGGCGTPPLETEENWWIPGHSAVLLLPEPDPTKRDG